MLTVKTGAVQERHCDVIVDLQAVRAHTASQDASLTLKDVLFGAQLQHVANCPCDVGRAITGWKAISLILKL